MSETGPELQGPPEAAAEAAAWLARRDRGLSEAEAAEFHRWRRADPRHAAEVNRLDAAWRRLDQLQELAGARTGIADPDELAPERHARWPRTAAIVLAAAAAVALAFVRWGWHPRVPAAATTATETTARGGYRRLALPDGTVAELNTASAIAVRYAPGTRTLDLLRGEVMLTVAHDPARPFSVRAGTLTITDVGTAFSVRRQSRDVRILVAAGRVRVDRPADPPAGMVLLLVANQRAVVPLAAGAEPTVAPLLPEEVDRLLAWRTGRLDFADTSLAEAATEFNRYNRTQLRIADAATAQLRIGGSFRTDNVDAFVRLLQSGFGVAAEPGPDGVITLRKRP